MNWEAQNLGQENPHKLFIESGPTYLHPRPQNRQILKYYIIIVYSCDKFTAQIIKYIYNSPRFLWTEKSNTKVHVKIQTSPKKWRVS